MAELTGDDPLHIRLISGGITTIDRTWDYPDVRSPYWRFYVNSRDGASAVVAGRRYPLSARRIHLLPAWMIFTCHNTAPIVHLHARFEVLGLPASLVRELFPLPISLGVEPELERGARHAARVLSSPDAVGPDDRLEIKALIHRALGRAFAQLPADRRSALGRMLGSAGPLAAAIQAIHGRIDQTHANEELARACGMSEDHFIKVFRTTIGQTPAQYVLERRMTEAAQRLLFTRETIDAIAAACGFPDRFYFTRMFSRRMGVAPAAYRRTIAPL